MADYNSVHSGQDIDNAISKVKNSSTSWDGAVTTASSALSTAQSAASAASEAQSTAEAAGTAAASAASAASAAQQTAGAALPKAGGTMTGAIAMGNNKITGLGAPTENTDAARKQDVDDFEPQSSAVQLSSAAQSALGLSAGATLDDALIQTANGTTLFETTVPSNSSKRINLSVDTSEWGNYDYVHVDVDWTQISGNGFFWLSANGIVAGGNSAANRATSSYLERNRFDEWLTAGSAAMGYLADIDTPAHARITFFVFKNTNTYVSCVSITHSSYCIGNFYQLLYSNLNELNFYLPSYYGSPFKGDFTFRIWGE